MKQTGVVSEVKDGIAAVRFVRSSACGENCAMCGGCDKRTSVVNAKNGIGAATGDRVVIETDTGMVLAGAFFAYIVPIILMFLGYDTLGCVGAVFGFLLPFIIFKFANKKLEKKFMPNITEIENSGREKP
mgnify:FL=1